MDILQKAFLELQANTFFPTEGSETFTVHAVFGSEPSDQDGWIADHLQGMQLPRPKPFFYQAKLNAARDLDSSLGTVVLDGGSSPPRLYVEDTHVDTLGQSQTPPVPSDCEVTPRKRKRESNAATPAAAKGGRKLKVPHSEPSGAK